MTPLAEVIAARLQRAGLAWAPELERIQQWNHQARVAAELDPRRAGHRDHRNRPRDIPMMHLGRILPDRAQ